MSAPRVRVVIPGDEPPQIGGSPHLDRLRERGEVILHDTHPADDAEKLCRAADADVLINSRGHVYWSGELLRRLPRLKMISLCGIGTDSIDLEGARDRGIVVSNVPGRTAPIVAEHALALLLAVARRVVDHTAELRAGRWEATLDVSLREKVLGVIGTGNIGTEMIRLARGIGMHVVAWSFHPDEEKARRLGFRYVELERLLRESDAISLHCRLSDRTRGLIGAPQWALLKRGALVVNTARGAMIDTESLVAALRSGHLGGAGLDVFDIEPLPPDHPLLACRNVVLTPHSADQTPEGIDILNAGAVENVLAYLDGRPQNVVT